MRVFGKGAGSFMHPLSWRGAKSHHMNHVLRLKFQIPWGGYGLQQTESQDRKDTKNDERGVMVC